MAALQIDIMKVKQLLLLKTRKVSNRKIAGEIGVDRNTVNHYVKKLKSSGHSFSALLNFEEAELQKLFPSKEALDQDRYATLHGLFPGFVNEMKKPGCTRQHLWRRYKQEHIDHYSYSQFCQLFSDWLESKKASGKLNHKAGEKLFIDYAGKKLQIVDRSTGEIREVEVFVGILPASSYTYVEASYDQSRESLVRSVGNCLNFFGGVPQAIVPDNLKSAVTKSSKYESVINKTFRDMGHYYGCVINPTRSYSPQDKALVEGAVKLVYQRIYYEISNMTFFSLEELNKQIRFLLERYNSYKLQTTGISRFKQFVEIEKGQLSPLPAEPYKIKHFNRAKVQKMGYVYLSSEKNYYSVPYRYIGRHVEVQHNIDTVEIYYNKKRIATHAKSHRRGNYATVKDHLSSTHRYYQSWNRDFFVKKAAEIGMETTTYVAKLIDQQTYPEVAFKRSQGIIALKNKYPRQRIEAACKKALDYDICSYRIIENILKNHTDTDPGQEQIKHEIKPHENLRSAANYK
ncbi:IS21 family transposase [Maribellus maritimus]|uniref:IS21 family transposase n=1 Tax=Maribellus maritimus TaxID=2870838 RepID=UPI001EEB2A34|nr:IS21 family transposase [Maribellus maritimus]MCG6191511.1 IS21 family transposase [Maribellus maritimus]